MISFIYRTACLTVALSLVGIAFADPNPPPKQPQKPVGFPLAPLREPPTVSTQRPEEPTVANSTTLPEDPVLESAPVKAEEIRERIIELKVASGTTVVPVQVVVPMPAEPPMLLPVPKAPPVDVGGPPEERRLPLLGAPLGTTPKANAQTDARFKKYLEEIVDPEKTLDLVLNRNRVLLLKQNPTRVQVTDETTASITVVSPRELSITGRKVGTTIVNLWFTDPNNPMAKPDILSYLVRVIPDPEAKERLERVYEALTLEINKAFPDSAIKLRLVGDKLVVGGNAKDMADAFQILRVVRANAPRQNAAANIPVGQVNVTLTADAVAAATDGPSEQSLQNYLVAGGPNVINLMKVGGEHQVMLKVSVAEVNRAAARSVGVNFEISNGNGALVFANRTGGIATGTGVAATGQTNPLNNLPLVISGGQVAAAINALKTLNLAKSYAEPNLVTLNGRAASFQAGGQFPVPVVTGFTSAGLQGVTFVPFGVSLHFTPYVTDGDRIRLAVNAEVSTRDAATSQTNIGGASVPSLTTRNFQNTVELRAGETLAVAGLIQSNFGSDSNRVPFLGDLPLLGRLFAFDRTSNADQELVILITPYLVHPLGKNDAKPCLPGADLIPPSDLEFYLYGRLQNYGDSTDLLTKRKMRACESQLLLGPVGYCGQR
jgi:pilus assembly protein CpaC